MSAQALLQVDGLCRQFGGLKAVDGLSLRLDQGRILGLLGPNGSGKSTALNLISGVIRPDRGSIRFKGRELAGSPSHRITRCGVARTFQLVRTFQSMTVAENVLAGMAFAGPRCFGSGCHARVQQLLDKVQLGDKAGLRASELTYVDTKRLELARALASGPQVLLLDEWLAGLNPTESREAVSLLLALRQEGISILMVEHVLDAVRALCDTCVVMNAGAPIAQGTPAEVLAHPEVIRAYLGGDDA
jgi:branched-chain amino acid transport system ATP-binding protein